MRKLVDKVEFIFLSRLKLGIGMKSAIDSFSYKNNEQFHKIQRTS